MILAKMLVFSKVRTDETRIYELNIKREQGVFIFSKLVLNSQQQIIPHTAKNITLETVEKKTQKEDIDKRTSAE